MKKLALICVIALASCSSQPAAPAVSPEVAAWQARAQGVTIIRDDWGIPHVYAKTDADVVFGGKADGEDVQVIAGYPYARVRLNGAAATDLWDVMDDAGGFSTDADLDSYVLFTEPASTGMDKVWTK